MMDKNFGALSLMGAGIVLLFMLFAWMSRWASFSDWEEGYRENEHYHRMAIDVIKARIKAREYALAMYRDISTTLCDNISDCMYCPYERDKNDRKCALWELNEAVKRMDIEEVHVDTKHDGGDGKPKKVMYDHHRVGGKRYDEPIDVCEHYERRRDG